MNDHVTIQQLLDQAWAKRRVALYPEAKELLKRAQGLCLPDDFLSLGRINHMQMQFAADHNQLEAALKWSLKSIHQYKKTGDPHKIAHAIRHLADLHRRLENNDAAVTCYREAIDLYRSKTPTPRGDLANALRGFAILLEKLAKNQEARTVWQETKRLYKACRLQAGVDEAQQRLDRLPQ